MWTCIELSFSECILGYFANLIINLGERGIMSDSDGLSISGLLFPVSLDTIVIVHNKVP